jgi:hypothetical protein
MLVDSQGVSNEFRNQSSSIRVTELGPELGLSISTKRTRLMCHDFAIHDQVNYSDVLCQVNDHGFIYGHHEETLKPR